MNNLTVCCFLLTLFFVSNCSQTVDSKMSELTPVEKVTMFSDSTFFGDLQEIIYQDSMFYLSDNPPKILKLNQNLELTETIHSIGKGPSEFNWISDISYNSDSLYMYDHSQSKFLVYDNNTTFIREFLLEATGNIFSFAVSNNRIYISTPFAENPITMFDKKNGKIVKTFGVQSADTASFNVYRNGRHLLISNDKLIAVSESDPVVRLFNLSGELLSTTRIKHSLIADRIAHIKETYKKPSPKGGYRLAILFRDAVVHDGKLYLIAVTQSEDIIENFTFVLIYDIKEDGSNLNPLQALKLYKKDRTDRLYGTELAVANDKIIVFDDVLTRIIHKKTHIWGAKVLFSG